MNSPATIGEVNNPKRVTIQYDGKTCTGASREYDAERARFDYDLAVSFLPRVKNPSKLTQITIDNNLVGDIINAIPSEYTKGFWVFYVKTRKEE